MTWWARPIWSETSVVKRPQRSRITAIWTWIHLTFRVPSPRKWALYRRALSGETFLKKTRSRTCTWRISMAAKTSVRTISLIMPCKAVSCPLSSLIHGSTGRTSAICTCQGLHRQIRPQFLIIEARRTTCRTSRCKKRRSCIIPEIIWQACKLLPI